MCVNSLFLAGSLVPTLVTMSLSRIGILCLKAGLLSIRSTVIHSEGVPPAEYRISRFLNESEVNARIR